jgi:hypothetical protein
MLALTAQVFREDYFGLFKYSNAKSTPECENSDTRCQSANGTVNQAGQCSYERVAEGGPCNWGSVDRPELQGFLCHLGACIRTTDACVSQQCANVDPECQAPQATCENGKCKYQNFPDGTLCNYGGGGNGETSGNNTNTKDNTVLVGASCSQGKCAPKTESEVSSFAYDASIGTGIVSGALAIEAMYLGVLSADLAGFAICVALVAMGWTGYSRDVGAYRGDDALVRSQNALLFISAGLAIIFALGGLSTHLKAKKKLGFLLTAIAIGNIIVSAVQFGLVAQLFSEHFDDNTKGVVDPNANILFNWSYTATIYAACVAIGNSIAIFTAGSVSTGFGAFQSFTGIIALAWASNHKDEGSYGSDFTHTALTWISFAIIAGAWSFFVGIYLIITGKANESKFAVESKDKSVWYRLAGAILFILACVIIGQVASLFDEHYLKESSERTRGSNMLIVDAGPTAQNPNGDNYGNAVSPFAWPISIWTSAVLGGFGIDALKHGIGSIGITALALTEAANLLGWAAQHTYFGSAVFDSIEGTTRGWQAVALGTSILAIFVAFWMLMSQDVERENEHDTDRRSSVTTDH